MKSRTNVTMNKVFPVSYAWQSGVLGGGGGVGGAATASTILMAPRSTSMSICALRRQKPC